jgi:hypothetical protein
MATNPQTASPQKTGEAASYLAQEFQNLQALYTCQPTLIQRFLDTQGRQLADTIVQNSTQLSFTLPDRIVTAASKPGEEPLQPVSIPSELREQTSKYWVDRLSQSRVLDRLRQRMDELETSANVAVVASASLIRYVTATQMVHAMLPAGRSVIYTALDGEEIPTIPVKSEMEPESAITATTDAIVEEDMGDVDTGRGELLVPYVPAARRFYLPRWIALDENDRLLVGSLEEAEAIIASMQRFLNVLHSAVALAPYMVADPEYQQKRYGMLGQLVNQGRALARYETQDMIQEIRRRAAAESLNRGLSLSLPYFDDQTLSMEVHKFDVIPAGRVMFVPAFVVLASRREQGKVAQDTRLDPSTRKHLMAELQALEKAFATDAEKR